MAKKSSGGKGYPGVPSYGLSLVLAIIPVTAWIFGIIAAIKNGSVLWALIRIIFGFNIIWLIDLIDMIVNKKLTWLV